MNRSHSSRPVVRRLAIAALTVAALAPACPPRAAHAGESVHRLADSTSIERWQLSNGLRVVVRHVPRARAVAITLGFPGGSDADPRGREGLAALAAEVAYFAPAGDVPERRREEMESLRPLGWNVKVTAAYTQFSEVASPAQFPGVLHQVALRLRGVKVTDAELKRALEAVRRDLGERYSGRIENALYYGVRELGLTQSPDRAANYASGKGLQGIHATEVQKRISEMVAPVNTVLSIVGNVASIDLHHMIESEFGSIPAGAPLRLEPPRLAGGADRVVPRAGTEYSVGVVAIVAPALTDSTHPAFYLHTLRFAALMFDGWGPPEPPLPTRFQYPVLDDPTLARFYPPIVSKDSVQTAEEFNLIMRQVPPGQEDEKTFEDLRTGLAWLFGGPLEIKMATRARTEPSVLYNLSSAQAARELWGDDAFWTGYRNRLAQVSLDDVDKWRVYFLKRANQVRLAFRPATSTGKASRR